MAIRANLNSPGVMFQAANGDLTPVTLIDVSAVSAAAFQWSVVEWPENIATAPAIPTGTGAASFTAPEAGQYVIQLVRSASSGEVIDTSQILLVFPDANGIALPAPGADYALANASTATASAGWAGSLASGLPGIAKAVRVALTNATAAVIPATATNPGTQSAAQFIRTSGGSANAKEYGAIDNDSANNIVAFEAAFAATNDVTYSGATYKVGNGTVGVPSGVHRFLAGSSKIHVPSGATLVLRGTIDAPPRQIFQVDTGGLLQLPDVGRVEVAWFGALGASDSDDDAPGIAAASSVFSLVGGGTVHFHKPPNGYFSIKTSAQVGIAGVQYQGVKWEFERSNISPSSAGAYVDFKVTADLGAGNAAIVNRGADRTQLGGFNIDANGLADYCLQVAAPLTASPGVNQSGITSWQVEFSGVVRNARIAQVLSGESLVEASVSGANFTVAGSASTPGHQLLVGNKVFLTKVLDGYALPGNFSQALVYRVTSVSKYGFTLCLDTDGTNTNVVASDGGAGRWLVGICDAGDCSQLRIQKAHFGECTVAGVVAQASFIQHGMNSLGSEIRAWSQGQMAEGGTSVAATIDGAAHTVTTSIQIVDGGFRHPQNGDACLLWAAVPGVDALPVLLPRDTEYFVVNVSGGGATRTFQLAAKPGGSPILFGAATGNIHIDILRSPFYHFVLIGGSMRLEKTSTVGARGRIKLLLRPNGTGAAASLGGQFDDDGDCQDWAYLHADNTAVLGSVTPQNGICTSKVKHLNIWNGAVADAVRWNTPLHSGLDLTGASLGGHIKVGASASPVHLGTARMTADGTTYSPLVVGSDGTTATIPGVFEPNPSYTSNGVEAGFLLPSAGPLMAGSFGIAPVVGQNNASALAAVILKSVGPTDLGRGTYEVSTDATVSVREHRQLRGQGIDATTLKLLGTSNYGMLVESQITGVPNTGIRVCDMTITAPTATQYAVGLKSSTDGSRILAGIEFERVNFSNCAAGAIQPVANHYLVDCVFRHCKWQNCNTTAYLLDTFDPNGTTIFLEDCYFSNNRNATDGCCIRAASDTTHLTNMVCESSGRLVDMLYTANVTWEGGRCEDMFGPIINATGNLPPGHGTVAVRGVMFERGPVLGATPVIIVNGFGLEAVTVENCSFEGWTSSDLVLANVSAKDENITIKGCTFVGCDAGFIAQFQRRATQTFTPWTNIALHSSFEDGAYTYGNLTSGTGGSFARDTVNHLDEDTASLALTYASGATATIELLSTATGISAGVTDDVVIMFKAWASAQPQLPVTGATNANPIVLTITGHGLTSGTTIVTSGVGGNAAANGTFAVTVIDANHVSIPIAGSGAYTSGGVAILDKPISMRALWTGDHDIANFRMDVDSVPRLFSFRAVAPPGGYLTGTYALFFEAPTVALPSSVVVNLAQVQVVRVPRGSHAIVDMPYAATAASTRLVKAGTTLVGQLQGRRSDGGVPFALSLSSPDGTQPATDSVTIYAQSTGALLAKTFDSASSPGTGGYVTAIVPDVQIGVSLGTLASGRLIRSCKTTSNVEVAFPATGLISPATLFYNASAGIPAGGVVQFTAYIMGHTAAGASGSYKLESTIKNVGGTLSVVGSQTLTTLASEAGVTTSTAQWEITLGGFLGVTGVAATTIVWTADISWRQLS